MILILLGVAVGIILMRPRTPRRRRPLGEPKPPRTNAGLWTREDIRQAREENHG